MDRRNFLKWSLTGLGGLGIVARLDADAALAAGSPNPWLAISDADWRRKLTAEQYAVLRSESTERPFSSPLNHEKRLGIFHCAGCDLPLFDASHKFDSGTGWPSFYRALPDAVATKIDHKLVVARTEYHCARCGGHHGHLFADGPAPTGLRYCNNGVALRFEAAGETR